MKVTGPDCVTNLKLVLHRKFEQFMYIYKTRMNIDTPLLQNKATKDSHICNLLQFSVVLKDFPVSIQPKKY